MSGHSKWSTIKHKKAKVDAAKGVTFAKYAREITVAAKMGGCDPTSNFRLRTALEKAKESGLPNDNIKRALDKASGAGAGDNIEELSYEGYAAGGVAVFVEAMTDNRNRTAGDIRSYFKKFNGNLGENGCVAWMFKPQGEIEISKENDFDKLFELAINAGAEDFIEDENSYKVITALENMQTVAEEIEKAGYKIEQAQLTRIPENTVAVTDETTARHILRLLDAVESHDDVQNVYANFDMSDELMEKISF
jgi:YebC/PmpR family DNA-binding regulatory protein